MASLMPGENLPLGVTPWNIDLATQQRDLDMKRQMLAALLMQQMQQQPTQMAGNIAIRRSPLAAMGSILTAAMANKGLGNVSEQERQLVQKAQDESSTAMQNLGSAANYQPGAPTTVNEEPGPPDANGTPSMSVYPGKAGGIDPEKFYKAYAAAQGRVDPKVLGDMLNQFNVNRMLLGNPDTAQFVPGYAAQGQPQTFTNAQGGTSVSLPNGGAPMAAGGGSLNVPPAVAGLNVAAGLSPALKPLAEAVTKYNEPVNVRPEGTVFQGGRPTFTAPGKNGQIVWDAQGNPSYRKIEGQQEAAASEAGAVAGAQAGAKAPYEFENVTLADGRVVPIAKSVLAGAVRPSGAAPGTAPAPGFAGNAPGGVIPPAVQAQANAGRLSILQNEQQQRVAQGLPPDPALEREIAQAKTSNVNGMPAMGQTTQSKSFAETSGSDLAKQFQGYRESADQAEVGRATVKQMLDALGQFNPNAGAPARQKIAEVLQAAGASDDTVQKVAGGQLDAMQEFTKLAFGNSVSNLRALVGPGQRISQLEMITNYKQSPNPSIQRAAAQTMLEMQDGAYRWAQDRNDAATQWNADHRDPAAFNGWWNRNHPLTGTDGSGQPYIPTIADVRARIAAAGVQKKNVQNGVDTATGVPQPNKTVMRFDAQGNFVQ